MLEYRDAERLFATAKVPANGKPLQNNTRLYQGVWSEHGGSCYEVWLHDTPVVTIYQDGTYVLKTGGWATVTTKDRLNTYGPGTVFQENRVWYWSPERRWNSDKGKYEGPIVGTYYFHDGMRVTTAREITDREDVYGPGRRKWDREHRRYTEERDIFFV